MHDFPIEFIQTWLVFAAAAHSVPKRSEIKIHSRFSFYIRSNKQNEFHTLEKSVISNFNTSNQSMEFQMQIRTIFRIHSMSIWFYYYCKIEKTVMKYEMPIAKNKNWDQNSSSAFMLSIAIVVIIVELCKIYVLNDIVLFATKVTLWFFCLGICDTQSRRTCFRFLFESFYRVVYVVSSWWLNIQLKPKMEGENGKECQLSHISWSPLFIIFFVMHSKSW